MQEFQPGSLVIYPMHGKCEIKSIEIKTVGNTAVKFYKMAPVKSTFSRSSKNEGAIWLPVDSANRAGLRSPATMEQAQAALAILANREYYFPLPSDEGDPTLQQWNHCLKNLEHTMNTEGLIGCAKVLSYLYVAGLRHYVPPTDLTKYADSIRHVIVREIADALTMPIRAIEEQIEKGLRHKLLPNN